MTEKGSIAKLKPGDLFGEGELIKDGSLSGKGRTRKRRGKLEKSK